MLKQRLNQGNGQGMHMGRSMQTPHGTSHTTGHSHGTAGSMGSAGTSARGQGTAERRQGMNAEEDADMDRNTTRAMGNKGKSPR
jgi:hypothetical protein